MSSKIAATGPQSQQASSIPQDESGAASSMDPVATRTRKALDPDRPTIAFRDWRTLIARVSNNVRKDYGDIPALADSLIDRRNPLHLRVRIMEPLIARNESTFTIITEGHRRMAAIEYISKNMPEVDIGLIPVTIYKGSSSPEDNALDQLIMDTKKPFTTPEKAAAYQFLINNGHNPEEIRVRWGVSTTSIKELKSFAEMPTFLLEMVTGGEITPHLANELYTRFADPVKIEAMVCSAREAAQSRFIGKKETAAPAKPMRLMPGHFPEVMAAREAAKRSNKPKLPPTIEKRHEEAKKQLTAACKKEASGFKKELYKAALLALDVAIGQRPLEQLIKQLGTA